MELFPPSETYSAEWIALHNLEAFVSVLDAHPGYVEWLGEECRWGSAHEGQRYGLFWPWLDAIPGIEEAIVRLPMRMKLVFIRVLGDNVLPDRCPCLFRAILSCSATNDDHWVVLGAFLREWSQCTDAWEAYVKLYAPHLDALECVVLRAKLRGERPSVSIGDWEFWSVEGPYKPSSVTYTLSDFDGWFDLVMSIIGYCRQEFPKDDGQVFEEYLESQGKMVPA